MLKKICVASLPSINIDSQIHFTADKFWLPQTRSLHFANNTRNTATPMFNQIHVGKSIGKRLVTNLRIPFFHTLQCLSHGNLAGRSNFQTIIIDCNLRVAVIQIATVHRSIDNQFTNGIRRNLINILPIDTFKGCAHVNIPQNKLICLINLFPNRSCILPAIHKNLFCHSFKYSALSCHMDCATAG
ncbi:hypothetical protein IMSAG185_00199 [Lachnospiraceae bacterium]|nr:hypothetical protein IMSAG185_00199 [Lachnospiraceae bacterium]